MVAIAETWISSNVLLLKLLHRIEWDIQGLEGLHRAQSYFVVSNHQSWVDIVVLQTVFNRRIPFMRFFVKQEMIRIPFLGAAWWALDFPFMKRFSKKYLEQHPEMRGQDLETTRRACAKFAGCSISVLNFLEGTRFTKVKHQQLNSPYQKLLPPKAGGLAATLDAMGNQFDAMIDVTIFYPGGAPTIWGLLSGTIKQVVVRVRCLPLAPDLLAGQYQDDPAFRSHLHKWVAELWQRKDQTLVELDPR